MCNFVSPQTVWQTQGLFTLQYLFKYLIHQAPQAPHLSSRQLLIDYYISFLQAVIIDHNTVAISLTDTYYLHCIVTYG